MLWAQVPSDARVVFWDIFDTSISIVEYQGFDNSIEEVSIYRGATIPPRKHTTEFQFGALLQCMHELY